jgi:hypothetical protein
MNDGSSVARVNELRALPMDFERHGRARFAGQRGAATQGE